LFFQGVRGELGPGADVQVEAGLVSYAAAAEWTGVAVVLSGAIGSPEAPRMPRSRSDSAAARGRQSIGSGLVNVVKLIRFERKGLTRPRYAHARRVTTDPTR